MNSQGEYWNEWMWQNVDSYYGKKFGSHMAPAERLSTVSSPFLSVMKTWIVSSLDEETIQGMKLYEEIRYLYLRRSLAKKLNVANLSLNVCANFDDIFWLNWTKYGFDFQSYVPIGGSCSSIISRSFWTSISCSISFLVPFLGSKSSWTYALNWKKINNNLSLPKINKRNCAKNCQRNLPKYSVSSL